MYSCVCLSSLKAVLFGASSQSYWNSHCPRISLQPSSICVFLTLVFGETQFCVLVHGSPGWLQRLLPLSSVQWERGVWFWIESLMLHSRTCLQVKLLFWFGLRDGLPFKYAPNRVCSGVQGQPHDHWKNQGLESSDLCVQEH